MRAAERNRSANTQLAVGLVKLLPEVVGPDKSGNYDVRAYPYGISGRTTLSFDDIHDKGMQAVFIDEEKGQEFDMVDDQIMGSFEVIKGLRRLALAHGLTDDLRVLFTQWGADRADLDTSPLK